MKCKCKNESCAKEYDSRETSRIYGDVPWRYKFCCAACFTQSIMKKGDIFFELYEPIDENVIAGPVEASNKGDAAIELLSAMGYEIRMVETERDENNEQG